MIILGKIEEYEVTGFSVSKEVDLIWLEFTCNGKTYSRNIDAYDIGKHAYLIKEEAEQALKESGDSHVSL